jgi:tetratricopeptide (TPR) repeat protein
MAGALSVGQAAEIPDHELLCLIGRGAYGEVWMARNAIGLLRAVKVVRRQSFQHADHFEREFKGLLRFEPISRSYDGFVDILHIGRRDGAGFFYYVMELADPAATNQFSVITNQTSAVSRNVGSPPLITAPLIPDYSPETLRSRIQERGRLPPAECITVGLKLAAALQHLHEQGLVHRDIKPSNIIFVNGEPKLADIGLVTAVDEAHSLVGTVGYIPPEGPGKPQADLYSLGKVLYEIAFGKERQEFPQLPPDLQSHPDYAELLELNEVVLKACESDPRKRYRSASEMKGDLALLQRGTSVIQTRKRKTYWTVARQFGFAVAVAAVAAAALPFLKGFIFEHKPNSEAEREYKLGRWFASKWSPEDHKKALEHLNRAVELDGKFVNPYRELAAIYVWGRSPWFASGERSRKLKELADKLLAMDPKLAEGHAVLSWYLYRQNNWRAAEDEIMRAVKLDPTYPLAQEICVFLLSMLGRADEAQRQAERLRELNPTDRTACLVAAYPFFAARQFDLTIAQAKRAVELDKYFPEAHNFLGSCYEAQSNYVAAIEEFRTFDLLEGHDRARVDANYDALREAYDTLGDQGYLRKMIELIHQEAAFPPTEQVFFEEDLAGYYARLGEKEKALEEIEKSWKTGIGQRLKYEPLFDTLHDESRFKALLTRAGLEP